VKRGLILLISLSLLLSCLMLSGCVGSQVKPTTTGVPEGYVIIKKDALADLMDSCIRCKGELLNCLERERK
jgi:hypothetical protein